MNLTPKQRFLKSPHAKVFSEIVINEALYAALEASIVQWQLETKFDDGEYGTASAMRGIKEYIKVFLNLVEPEPPAPAPIRQNLKPV